MMSITDHKGRDIAVPNQPAGRPLRVNFLAVIPSPYMTDLFDTMYEDARFRLRVHYLQRPALAAPGVYWCEKPLAPYASALSGRRFTLGDARIHVGTEVLRILEADRPDLVVVLGYSSLTYQVAMYWLWLKRIPWIFWGEIPGFQQRGICGRLLRWLALRPVAWLAHGVAAIGSRAAHVYATISRKGLPVWNIPYYCRTEIFDPSRLLQVCPAACSSDDPPKDKVRPTRAGVHYLFCGQLIPRKGVDLLIRSFCRVALDHQEVRLTLVGDGPLRTSLAARVPEAIRQRVVWAGFKEVDELPPFFAEANVFVLPSLHDGWGVVINQAVSAGMAVIASDTVGAASDLVCDHANGLIVPSQDEDALTGALRFFAERPDVIPEFGRVSREKARWLTPQSGADRWYQFAQRVLKRRAGW